MIISNNLGFLVPVMTFGCLLSTEILVEAAFQDDRYYQKHGWPKQVALLAAAGVVAVVGRYLNRRQGKVLMDPETGAEVIVGGEHTFFFIPVEYWPPILIVLAMIFSFITD